MAWLRESQAGLPTILCERRRNGHMAPVNRNFLATLIIFHGSLRPEPSVEGAWSGHAGLDHGRKNPSQSNASFTSPLRSFDTKTRKLAINPPVIRPLP